MKVNNIPTVDIKGKQYTTVKDRVMYFQDKFKDHALLSIPIKIDENIAIFEAQVVDPNGKIISNGFAYESSANGFINKVNHIENADTSAKGRALGFLGIGIVAGIATADDVKRTEEIPNEIADKIEVLQKNLNENEIYHLLAFHKVKKLSELTAEQVALALDQFKERISARNTKD